MIGVILECVWEVVLYCLFVLVWWLILFPVIWLVSLPFILVLATTRPGPYLEAVADMLVSVHHYWRDNGLWILS